MTYLKPTIPFKENDFLTGSSGIAWRLGRPLGQGRCCVVHEGLLFGEEVNGAVKIYDADDNFTAASLRESGLLHFLKKNVPTDRQRYLVNMLDEFMYRNHQCLVQECLGDNLRLIITKHGGDDLSLWLIQKLLHDILRSLEILHSLGYIHADVKLTNVLWSPQDGCAKLIDLGLTFHTTDYEVAQAVQASFYRAPETWLRMHQLEKRAIPESTNAYGWTQNLYNASSNNQKAISSQSSTHNHVKQNRCSDHFIKLTSAIDVWSVGRVIIQLFTCGHVGHLGEEHHQYCQTCRDYDNSLECGYATRITESLIQRRDIDTMENAGAALDDLKDLTKRLSVCQPEERLTASEALKHPFFTHMFDPTSLDIAILPSRVLGLMNMIDHKQSLTDPEAEDILDDIKSQCARFGCVDKCVFGKEPNCLGTVLVLYADAMNSIQAYTQLNGRIFNDRTVVTTYYPYDRFIQENI